MIQSLRVFVIVGVMIFATVGCQKGTQSAAKGNAATKEAEHGSNGTETSAKAEKSSAPGTDAAAGASQTGGKGSALTLEDDGSVVDLRVGQVLTVVLNCNRSAGLTWAMAEPTAAVMVPEGKPVYAATTGKTADDQWTGTETWRFRAAQRGRQTVRLEYRREWQRDVPERTFRFTANVR